MYKIVKRMEKGKLLLYRVDYTEQGIKITWDNVPDIPSKMKLGDLLTGSISSVHYCIRDRQAIQVDCIEQEFYDETINRIFYSGNLTQPVIRGKRGNSAQSTYRTPIPNIVRVKIAEKE